jgi:hypothetical protein
VQFSEAVPLIFALVDRSEPVFGRSVLGLFSLTHAGGPSTLETLNKWLPIYTALITTGLLAAIITILRNVVSSKDATIETLKSQIEWLQTQTVEAVHARNKALMEEIEALDKQRKKEIAELEVSREKLAKEVEGLRADLQQRKLEHIEERIGIFSEKNNTLAQLSKEMAATSKNARDRLQRITMADLEKWKALGREANQRFRESLSETTKAKK